MNKAHHIAIDLILDHARDVEYLSISEHLERYDLPPEIHDEMCKTVANLIKDANISVDWDM